MTTERSHQLGPLVLLGFAVVACLVQMAGVVCVSEEKPFVIDDGE